MKKNFFARSLTALFLAMAMLLSLVLCACDTEDEDKDSGKSPSNGDNDCTEHVDDDENGKCDNCEADLASDDDDDSKDDNNEDGENPGNTDDSDTGLTLSKAVVAQLEAAQSMKIGIDMQIIRNEEYWFLSYWDNSNDSYLSTPNPIKNDYYEDAGISMTITVSKTQNGINAKIDAEQKSRDEIDAEYETESNTYLYLVDGVIYSYDSYGEIYEKTELYSSDDIKELEDAIAELTGGIEISEDDKNTILSTLGNFVITTFNVKDNKGSVSLDVKPAIDDFFGYINGLDMENDTVEGVINDALALVDKELTLSAILTELERISGLTVDQAVTELDTWLTEHYETTLQGIYDTVVNDQRFTDIITEYMKSSDPDLDDEDINGIITGLKGFKIADFISQNNIGSTVIYDLLIQFIADGDTEDAPTRGALFGAIKDLFAMKLGDFEEETHTPIFTYIKERVSNITVNELNAKLDINFKGVFNIDTIEATLNYDVIIKELSEVEGKYNVLDTDADITIKIYDISKDTIAISAPTDFILAGILDEWFDSESEDYDGIFIDDNYDGTFNIEIDCYAGDDVIYISTNEIDIELLKSNTLTIDGELLEFYSSEYELLDHDENTDLIIVFDIENGSYKITQIPTVSAE